MSRGQPWIRWAVYSATLALMLLASIAQAQDRLTLSSSAFKNDGAQLTENSLPADLQCKRDGGDGASPPLSWTSIPEGTKSLALIMHHYPRGTTEGVDAPSQYWLLWNISAETTNIDRGNTRSIGTEGSDKDGRHTGYTAPCSPSGQQHEYTITLYALDSILDSLPSNDDISVDWQTLSNAMKEKIIASSKIVFKN